MKRLALLSVLFLTACASPQETVFAARGAHNIALRAAVTYAERPSCTAPTAPLICARADIVQRIDKADDVAKLALDAAEETVRTPGFGNDVYRSAARAASAAVGAFTSILDTVEQ